MNRRFQTSTYVIAVLAAIGVLMAFLDNPGQMLIPTVIFGTVFLLWKFPPNRWKRQKGYRSASSPSKGKSAKDKRKHVPFKVIQGNKRDDKESEQQYPYH